MAVADIARVFLAAYFVAVGVLYTAKLLAMRSRTGRRLQSFGAPGSPQFVGRLVFEAFRAAIVAACVARVFAPEVDAWFGPLAFAAATPALQALGLVVLLVALGLVTYAHNYLGDEWRTGVPRDGPAGLVTTGIYARLRHPIFLGVHLGQIGLFLAWPSIFTLVCLIVGFAVIQVQARVEEAKLAQAFGQAYEAWRRRTPGFVPLVQAAPRPAAEEPAVRIFD